MNKITVNSKKLLNILTNKSIFYKVKDKKQIFINYLNCINFKITSNNCIISTTNNYCYSENKLNVLSNENNQDIEFNINYLDIKELINFINENKTKEDDLIMINFTPNYNNVIFHYNNNEAILNNEPLVYPILNNALKFYDNDSIQIKNLNNSNIISILKENISKYKKDKKIKLTNINIYKGLSHKIVLEFKNNNLSLNIVETIIQDCQISNKTHNLCNIPLELNKINETVSFNFYLFHNIINALDNNIDNITFYCNSNKDTVPLIFHNDNNKFLIMSVADKI